jgi:septum formation protein
MPLNQLKPFQIILASKSPRRQQLLAGLDIPFQVEVRDEVEEVFPENLDPLAIGMYLAQIKSKPFDAEIAGGRHIVITADTLVWAHGSLLSKPTDFEDGYRILRALSGKMHRVITGVSIKARHREVCFSDETLVWFKQFDDCEIQYYLTQYQPFDKAGAYGAQEWLGFMGIDRIEGSYFNVMGLPIHRVYDELKKFNINNIQHESI